jgi:hypothetical protein
MRRWLPVSLVCILAAFFILNCGSSEEGPPDVDPPVVSSVDYSIAPIGSSLTVGGSGFTGVHTVTIGGAGQPDITVSDDTSVLINEVAVGTPMGVQGMVLTDTVGSSAALSVEIFNITYSTPALAHGSQVSLTLNGLVTGLQAGTTDVFLGVEDMSPVVISPTSLVMSRPVPDTVPTPSLLAISTGGIDFAPVSRDVAHLVVNELDCDQTGSPDTGEFIEIASGASGIDLDGYSLLLLDGGNDEVYNAIDLSGWTTDANGLLVVGNVGIVSRDIGIVDNSLQNGADAVAIYQGTGFSVGTTIGDLSGFIVIDALVYDTDDLDDTDLLNGLPGYDGVQVNENQTGAATIMAIQRSSPGSSRLMGGVFSVEFPPSPDSPN